MKKQLEWDDLQPGDWVLTTKHKGRQAFVETIKPIDYIKSFVGSSLDLDRTSYYSSGDIPLVYPAIVVRPQSLDEIYKLQRILATIITGTGPVDVNKLILNLRNFQTVYERPSEVELTVSKIETYLKESGRIPKEATLKIVKEE